MTFQTCLTKTDFPTALSFASPRLCITELQLSIGDIAVVARLNWINGGSLEGIPTTIVDAYPLLLSLVKRVMAEPKIVAYVEGLPKK